MSSLKHKFFLLSYAGLAILLMPMSAFAYIGPGAGISAIGTVLALIGAVLFAIVGFLFFPIKRYLRKRKQAKDGTQNATDSADLSDTDRDS